MPSGPSATLIQNQVKYKGSKEQQVRADSAVQQKYLKWLLSLKPGLSWLA